MSIQFIKRLPVCLSVCMYVCAAIILSAKNAYAVTVQEVGPTEEYFDKYGGKGGKPSDVDLTINGGSMLMKDTDITFQNLSYFTMNGGNLLLHDTSREVNLTVGNSTGTVYMDSISKFSGNVTSTFMAMSSGAGFNAYQGLEINGGSYTIYSQASNSKFNVRDDHLYIFDGNFDIQSSRWGLAGVWSLEYSQQPPVEYKIQNNATNLNLFAGARPRTEKIAGSRYLNSMLPGTLLGGRTTVVALSQGASLILDSAMRRDGAINPNHFAPSSRFVGLELDISNTTFYMGRNSWLESLSWDTANPTYSQDENRGILLTNGARILTKGGDLRSGANISKAYDAADANAAHVNSFDPNTATGNIDEVMHLWTRDSDDFSLSEAAMIRSTYSEAVNGIDSLNKTSTYGLNPQQIFRLDSTSTLSTAGRDITIANFQNATQNQGGGWTAGNDGIILDGTLIFGGDPLANVAGDGTTGSYTTLPGHIFGTTNYNNTGSNENNVGNLNIMNATGKLTANTNIRLDGSLLQGMAVALNDHDAYKWTAEKSTLLINSTRLTSGTDTTSENLNQGSTFNAYENPNPIPNQGGTDKIFTYDPNDQTTWPTQNQLLGASNISINAGQMDYSEFLGPTGMREIKTALGTFWLVRGDLLGWENGTEMGYHGRASDLYIDRVTNMVDFRKPDALDKIQDNINDKYGPDNISPDLIDQIFNNAIGGSGLDPDNTPFGDRAISSDGSIPGEYNKGFLDGLIWGYGQPFEYLNLDGTTARHFTSRGLTEFYMGSTLSKVLQLNQDTARSTIRNVANRFDWIHRQGDDREQAVYNAIKSGDAYATFMLPNLEYCISNRVWASAIGQWDRGSMSKKRQIAGYTYNAAGAMIGLEHEHGPFTVGIAGSYMSGKYRDHAMDRNSSRLSNYSVNAYATWTSCNKWFVTALAGYMHSNNKLNFGSADVDLNEDFKSNSWYAEGKVGHDFWFGCTGQERFRITPAVALGYIHSASKAHDGYNKTIGYKTHRFGKQKIPSWYLPITVEAVKDWDLCNGGRITLNVNGGYTYNSRMEGTNNNMTLLGMQNTVSGAPVTYKTWGQRRSHGQWNAGVKLGYTARKWEVNVGYDWFGRQNANTHRLNATLGIYF